MSDRSVCSGPGAYLADLYPDVEHCCVMHDEEYTKGGDGRLRHIVDVEFLH